MAYYLKDPKQSDMFFGHDGVSSYTRMGLTTFKVASEVWEEHHEEMTAMLSSQIADTAIILTRYAGYGAYDCYVHFGSRDSAAMFRLLFAEYITPVLNKA